MYSHKFSNGTGQDCRQYENLVLSAFIKYVDKEWMYSEIFLSQKCFAGEKQEAAIIYCCICQLLKKLFYNKANAKSLLDF